MTLSNLPNLRILGLLDGDELGAKEAVETVVVSECYSRCPRLKFVVHEWTDVDYNTRYTKFWAEGSDIRGAPHKVERVLGDTWWSIYEVLL